MHVRVHVHVCHGTFVEVKRLCSPQSPHLGQDVTVVLSSSCHVSWPASFWEFSWLLPHCGTLRLQTHGLSSSGDPNSSPHTSMASGLPVEPSPSQTKTACFHHGTTRRRIEEDTPVFWILPCLRSQKQLQLGCSLLSPPTKWKPTPRLSVDSILAVGSCCCYFLVYFLFSWIYLSC